MKPFFYDLTELLYLSGGFKSYYGVAKVVAEGAREAYRAQIGVRFVAFSQAHGDFFEVFPSADAKADGGVALNVPNAGRMKFMRRTPTDSSSILGTLMRPFWALADRVQRKVWDQSSLAFAPVDMTNGVLVSCARPKLIVAMAERLRQWTGTELHALIHDVMPLYSHEKSKAFKDNYIVDTNYVLKHSAHIVANSHQTAADIERFAGEGFLVTPRRLSVAQLGHEFRAGDDPRKITLPEQPYILMVGTALGRKNLNVVLLAMANIATTNGTMPTLVLAGRRRKRTMSFLDRPEMAAVKPHVLQIDSPNASDLAALYASAWAVILPSEIEGWGLPAAEALWFNTPAICSDIPVFREVCGDLGVYFPVHDHGSLAGILTRLTQETEWRQALATKITENRDQLRTWQDFGQDLLRSVTKGAA